MALFYDQIQYIETVSDDVGHDGDIRFSICLRISGQTGNCRFLSLRRPNMSRFLPIYLNELTELKTGQYFLMRPRAFV